MFFFSSKFKLYFSDKCVVTSGLTFLPVSSTILARAERNGASSEEAEKCRVLISFPRNQQRN